jgi:hypothetical protein
MAYINTAFINNGTLLATAHKFAMTTRLNASYDGSSTVTLDLASVGTVGTYNSITTDVYGRIVSGSLLAYLTSNQPITVTGDATGTGTTSIALTLANIATAGTFQSIVINSKGLVTAGGSLTSTNVTNALGFIPVSTAALGAASGVATLDVTGKLTTTQIPTSLIGGLNYQGTWNASTNSPTLTSSTGTKGYYYKVSTAGSTTLDGISVWYVGDTAVFDGTTWDKIDGITNEVVSVNGFTGAVVLTVSNISGAAPLASPAFTGTPTAPTPILTDNSGNLATTSFVKGQGYLTTNQSITVSGDATGTGTNAITLTLATVNSTPGTFTSFVVNGKGLVTSGANLAVSGDVTGTASNSTLVLTLATVATAGTYQSVVINNKGLVVSGSSLTSANVTTALGYTPSTPVVTTPGTYNSVTINSAGQVIAATNASYSGGNIILTLNGAVTGTVASSSGTITVSTTFQSSPAFLGIPTAPTAIYGTNTTQLATTAFVTSAQGNNPPTIFITNTGNTIAGSQAGAMVEITGTVISAATVVSAVGVSGEQFTFFNNSTQVFTGTSLGGVFSGPGGSGNTLLSVPAGAKVSITSDGTNWIAGGYAYTGNIGPWLQLSGGAVTGTVSFATTVTAPTVVLTDSSTNVATTSFVKGQGYLTTNQSITISGDASGTGTTSIPLTLATVNVAPGTFTSFVVNGKGLVTSGVNMTFTGDATGTATGSTVALTLATVVTAGTYQSVSVNAKGLVVAGSSLTSANVTTALGYTPSTPIVSTAGTYNNVVINTAGQVVSGTSVGYITANQTITLSGDVSGSGTTAIPTTLATVNASPGTFTSFVVNGKGLVTSGVNLTATGDATGTASGSSIALTLAASGVTPGTYSSIVVNSKGLVTQGLAGNAAWSRLAVSTATATVGTASTYVGVNYAGTVTVTLALGSTEGRILYIKDESGAAYTNNITIVASTPDTIDGSTTTILNVNYEGAQLIYSGSAWRQL